MTDTKHNMPKLDNVAATDITKRLTLTELLALRLILT